MSATILAESTPDRRHHQSLSRVNMLKRLKKSPSRSQKTVPLCPPRPGLSCGSRGKIPHRCYPGGIAGEYLRHVFARGCFGSHSVRAEGLVALCVAGISPRAPWPTRRHHSSGAWYWHRWLCSYQTPYRVHPCVIRIRDPVHIDDRPYSPWYKWIVLSDCVSSQEWRLPQVLQILRDLIFFII